MPLNKSKLFLPNDPAVRKRQVIVFDTFRVIGNNRSKLSDHFIYHRSTIDVYGDPSKRAHEQGTKESKGVWARVKKFLLPEAVHTTPRQTMIAKFVAVPALASLMPFGYLAWRFRSSFGEFIAAEHNYEEYNEADKKLVELFEKEMATELEPKTTGV
eukprot:GHVN01006737.1.p1 GENE.GHVN01006737.1~~GHVN01006737.1.p1  ORF type:complete len:168 (+),score=12.83 GHVN01006737.1:36-506(+)